MGKRQKGSQQANENVARKKEDREIRQVEKKKREAERWNQGGPEYRKQFQQFSDQLKPLGLVVRDVEGDGACMFRALSIQMHGDESKHLEVRDQIVDYLAAHADHFSFFIESETETFGQYCNRMRRPKEWGSHLELQAASLRFNVNIHIYQLDTPRWDIVNFGEGVKILRLSYHNRDHYASVHFAQAHFEALHNAPKAGNKHQKQDKPSGHANNDEKSKITLIVQSTGINESEARKFLLEFEGDSDSVIEYLISSRNHLEAGLGASDNNAQVEEKKLEQADTEMENNEEQFDSDALMMVVAATGMNEQSAKGALRYTAGNPELAIAMLMGEDISHLLGSDTSNLDAKSAQDSAAPSPNDTNKQPTRKKLTKAEKRKLKQEKKREKDQLKAKRRKEAILAASKATTKEERDKLVATALSDGDISPEELEEIRAAIAAMENISI